MTVFFIGGETGMHQWRHSPNFLIRNVWRYQRGNQKQYIAEVQTTQWPTEINKRASNEQQNTTNKTKDRATRTPIKTRDELRCSERVGRSCSTCGIPRVTLLTFIRYKSAEVTAIWALIAYGYINLTNIATTKAPGNEITNDCTMAWKQKK